MFKHAMKLERNLKQNCRGKMLKSHCNWTRLSLVVWHLNSNTVKLALPRNQSFLVPCILNFRPFYIRGNMSNLRKGSQDVSLICPQIPVYLMITPLSGRVLHLYSPIQDLEKRIVIQWYCMSSQLKHDEGFLHSLYATLKLFPTTAHADDGCFWN